MSTANRRDYGKGSIRALPSGRYQVRIRWHGEMISAGMTFDARQDAEAWIRLAQRQMAKGTFKPPERAAAKPPAPPADRQTLRQHADRWLAHRDLKPRTRIEYRGLLDRHILPVLGDEPVAEIAPETIRAWYAQCSPGHDSTRAKAYSLLKTVFAQLVDDETLARNPCRIKSAGTAPIAKRARIVTPEQLAEIAGAMPADLQLAVMLGAYGGMRLGEVLGLKRSDIDIEHRLVIVRRTAVQLPGGPVEGTPKSAAGWRSIAIPEAVWPMIERHLVQHTGTGPDAFLFPARTKPGKPLSTATFYSHWYAARKAAGLPGLPFHDLRHSGATWFATAGATVAEVMRRVGHSTPKMALHYVAALDARDATIAGQLPVSLPSNVVPIDRAKGGRTA
jgi:integrase